VERASEAQHSGAAHQAMAIEVAPSGEEKLPTTGALVDISPLALRMSSPFNPGYWLAAA